MIQSNDLRVGNIVGVDTYGIGIELAKVTGINTNGTAELIGVTFPGSTFSNTTLHIPIHLSPEILEKCGFELNRNNELSIEINDIASHLELMRGVDGFYYPSFTQTPQGDEERTVYFNRINSLHQIQNLYFSLCGEELTYNQ